MRIRELFHDHEQYYYIIDEIVHHDHDKSHEIFHDHEQYHELWHDYVHDHEP